MTELLTSAQMRAIEQAAIESGAVTGLELMERAGKGVVEAIFAEWPELADTAGALPRTPGYLGQDEGAGARRPHALRAVVLCGPGNNGGDGFVVARLLKERGWEVEVFLYGDAEKLPPDARVNYERWCGMGGVVPLGPEAAAEGLRPHLLIDALFGIGVTRPVPVEVCVAFHAVKNRKGSGARQPLRIVAVDCPSGMDCDTGNFVLPPFEDHHDLAAFRRWNDDMSQRLLLPDLTVTFHAPKQGHYLSDISRRVRIADIGLGRWMNDPGLLAASITDPGRVRLVAPEIRKGGNGARMWVRSVTSYDHARHKFDRGHALILAGGPGQGGAARLAARGALRAGAGLVTVACPPEALTENAARLDAVMLRAVADAPALAKLLEDQRIGAICLGPGLGLERARDLVPIALAGRRRTVLDADALTAFRDDPEALFALCRAHAPASDDPFEESVVVMTPHEGEFARLFPDLSGWAKRAVSKVDVVRAAARRSSATVLLKGAATVIARPDGAASIHTALYDRAAPQLATAGAGDVLAGFITGLIAGQLVHEPYKAVELAAWLHTECALSFGPGLIAEDLPDELPKVFRALGL
ncbi:MAG: NAD(P)H-hydrate dehydratase [Paracoccaceae bacterium]